MHDDDDHTMADVETHDTLAALRKERERLSNQLTTCRQDLKQARKELARAREIQESLTEQLHAHRDAADQSADPDIGRRHSSVAPVRGRAWPVRAWRRLMMPPALRATRKDAQLLRESQWFDADWYLVEYPDVANSGVDPAEHYLRYGAPEGRDPGPLFSTDAYLRKHPALAGTGANPLLHFLRNGRGEGA